MMLHIFSYLHFILLQFFNYLENDMGKHVPKIILYCEIIQGTYYSHIFRLFDRYSRFCSFIQLPVVLCLLHYHSFSLHWLGESIFHVHLHQHLFGMICF